MRTPRHQHREGTRSKPRKSWKRLGHVARRRQADHVLEGWTMSAKCQSQTSDITIAKNLNENPVVVPDLNGRVVVVAIGPSPLPYL